MQTPQQKREVRELVQALEAINGEMTKLESTGLSDGIQPAHQHGARNLLHYLVLRRQDIRALQRRLAALGLSSLGRTESHVLGAVQTVLHLLKHLDAGVRPAHDELNLNEGASVLEANTEVLLGPAPEGRKVRIMVTMPSEAATDYDLVRELLAGGMNCMRINCAHDGPAAWAEMIAHLRRAEKELSKSCKVEMDVAGPKLRTGPIAPGAAVLKYRPRRDAFGRVTEPARLWLTPEMHPEAPPTPADACLPVPAAWLARLEPGQNVRFTDARGARRSFVIGEAVNKSCWAQASKTAYVVPGLLLTAAGDGHEASRRTHVGKLPPRPQTLLLKCGDTLVLTRALDPGRPADFDDNGELLHPARIGVTLPEFFDCVRPDEPIWFDDGNIGGVITAVQPDEVQAKIVRARPQGEKLGAEKGINVPETQLRVSSLTAEDIQALEFIAKHADILGFSFVREKGDVRELHDRLAAMGRPDLGIILKIETRDGFENLPELLMEAMHSRAVGIMIARGDLAVECGYERLAEIQEEILWLSEAAHVPVVWATQVLESMTKTGKPSRSEITDAAMGERAECVMLNKGPFVVQSVHILDDILRRMGAHQEKKTPMLRKLNVAAAFGPT